MDACIVEPNISSPEQGLAPLGRGPSRSLGRDTTVSGAGGGSCSKLQQSYCLVSIYGWISFNPTRRYRTARNDH